MAAHVNLNGHKMASSANIANAVHHRTRNYKSIATAAVFSSIQFNTPSGRKVTPSFAVPAGNTSVNQPHVISPPTPPSTSWTDFAKNVSGEWDGFGADFSKDGKPVELPESVVPEAYREWEVKVYDWQTQCPTIALQQHPNLSLTYNLIRLLPTVGCEADAATRYSIDQRSADFTGNNNQNQVSAFAYQSSGCYAAIWPVPSSSAFELEHCLIHPLDRESRMRIIQVVRFLDNRRLELQSIRVFCEQWYGPFRNGEQLGGCAIRDSAFASTQPLKASQITGAWQGLKTVANFQEAENNTIKEFVDESVQKLVRDERDVILLPKQLWCSLKCAEDGDTCCEAGWLLDQYRAITSKFIFSTGSGKLKEIHMACETSVKSDE